VIDRPLNALGELPGDAALVAARSQIPPRPQTSLQSVSLVTALTFVQLLLQFATQLVLARYFGAAGDMDAYVAALALPVVVATILSGSLGYVLVPAIAQQLEKSGQPAAATIAAQVGLYLLGLSSVATAAVAGGAWSIAAALCPGFPPERIDLTAQLLRVLSLLIVGNCLIAYLNALFHAYRRFLLPAAAGVVGTLVTLGYVVVLHGRQGILAVAWGVVLGSVVTVVMLAPFFWKNVSRAASGWQPLDAATRRCLWLLLPLVLGAIYWRLDPLLDRYLGSSLAEGSIAHMGYAWRLVNGLMLVGTSGLSIVAFPAIAAHAAAGRRDELSGELAHAIRFFLFVIVPVCIGLAAFSTPIVRLLFEHGRFTSGDTRAVSLLVALYVGVIFGAGLGDLLARTCYAQHDTLGPVIVSSLVFTAIAAAKFLVAGSWGAAGLVAATSCYYVLNAAVLSALVMWRIGASMLAGTVATAARASASSVAACLAASLVINPSLPISVLLAAGVGGAAYLLAMWLLRDEFAARIESRLRSRA
jgi:putative peptidoglycan lipid II flippase